MAGWGFLSPAYLQVFCWFPKSFLVKVNYAYQKILHANGWMENSQLKHREISIVFKSHLMWETCKSCEKQEKLKMSFSMMTRKKFTCSKIKIAFAKYL